MTGGHPVDHRPPSPRPALSVAVCTHNRSGRLARALGSLLRQTAAPGRFELLVVDNASTDGTAAHIATLRDAGAPLRCLHEPRLGLAHARNRALREAQADYVAFLDDDELAAPDWVERLIEAIARISPAPGCIGGRIQPLWECDRPDWLDDSLLGFMSVLDLGETMHRVDPAKTPLFGGNLCVAREPILALGGFDPALGRRGNLLLSNEDTWAQRQLERAGFETWYVPLAKVHHEMPRERLTPEWMLERAWWQGFSDSRMHRLEGGSVPRRVAGIARWQLRDMWRRYLAPAPDPRPAPVVALLRSCTRHYFAGTLHELVGSPKSRPSATATAMTGQALRTQATADPDTVPTTR